MRPASIPRSGLDTLRDLSPKSRGPILACALAMGYGALAAAFSNLLLPVLLTLVLAGLVVLPMRSVHARLSGYLVASVVLFGLLLWFAASQSRAGFAYRPLQAQFVVLAVAALLAAHLQRRSLPLVLLATLVLLALVDVAAFVNVGFSRGVLTGGLQLYLGYFLFALFVYYSSFDEREMRGLLLMMGVVLCVVAVVAVVQFLTGKWLAPFALDSHAVAVRLGFHRAIGFLAWPNELALFAGSWFFLFYSRAGRSGWALFYGVACAAAGISIVLSMARAAIVGMAVVVFLFQLRRLSVRARLVVCVVVVVLAATLGASASPGLVREASTIGSAWRTYYLVQGLKVWERNPLAGVGFNRYATSPSAQTDAGPSVLDEYHILTLPIRTTDAFLANIMPEFGLLGAGVLLVAFLLLVWVGVRRGRIDRVTQGYLGCLLMGAASMFTSSHGLYAPHTVAIWISVGMLARSLHSGGLTRPAIASSRPSSSVRSQSNGRGLIASPTWSGSSGTSTASLNDDRSS